MPHTGPYLPLSNGSPVPRVASCWGRQQLTGETFFQHCFPTPVPDIVAKLASWVGGKGTGCMIV